MLVFILVSAHVFPVFSQSNHSFSSTILPYGPLKLYVGGIGPGNFSLIQDAIDNASDGDVVYVYNGFYQENLLIETSLSLRGQDNQSTIIDGGNSGDVPCIDVRADQVSISRFKIQWSDWEFHEAGIRASADHVLIEDNVITTHDKGILFHSSAKYGTIRNNVLVNNHESIYIWPTGSDGAVIEQNTIIYNDYAFKIFNSNDNIIRDNIISFNNWYGILMQNAKDNLIYRNTFVNNSIAISTDSVSTNNTFFHNNLIDNLYQVIDVGFNTWYLEKPVGGNFWSDYNGSDTDGDGFGDIPHNIPGRIGNYDHAPFMRRDQWDEQPLDVSMQIPSHGFIDETLGFHVSVMNATPPLQYIWDFGDGYTAEGQQVNHQYQNEGVFSVSVTVEDGMYSKETISEIIEIYDSDEVAPTVSFVSPKPGIHINHQLIYSFQMPWVIGIGGFTLRVIAEEQETCIVSLTLAIGEETIHQSDSSSFTYLWPSSKKGVFRCTAEAVDLAGNSDTVSLSIIAL